MAVCHWCDQEMLDTVSCAIAAFHRDGMPIERTRNSARSPDRRCGDCGTPRNGYHHPGCDLEECPTCRRQALSCGCRYDEDGPLPVGWE